MEGSYFNGRKSIFLGILIIITIISLIALGPYFKLQFVVTNGLLPALFLIALVCHFKSQDNFYPEFIWLFLILVGGFMTIYYYQNYDGFMTGLFSLIGALMAAYISIGLNSNKDYSAFFHIGYILSCLILIVIMYINGNFNFSNFATDINYRDRFLLNANAYSYFSFFANISLFYLHQRYKSAYLTALLFLVPILFIIISFVTQSRSGLVMIVLINLVYWLFIAKKNRTNSILNLLRKLLTFSILIVLSLYFLNIYQNSRIKNRVDTSINQGDARGSLIEQSLNVFYENPIIGVGLGQLPLYTKKGQFSHNSYVEILAEQGIIGGIFLFMLFFIPLKKSLQLFKCFPKNPIFRLNLLFFVSFYIFNNIYPFYKFPFSMMYFFLMISYQNKIINITGKNNSPIYIR